MKDMYDFHRNKESQNAYFEVVTKAYLNCFQELGLEAHVVNASGGSFSDKFSREFQVVCSAGEDRLYHVPGTEIFYNEEVAPVQAPEYTDQSESTIQLTKHVREGLIGVNAISQNLSVPVEKCTKTIVYTDSHHAPIVAVVRADRDISEEKLRSLHKSTLRLSTAQEVEAWTGCPLGYAGLVNLPEVQKVNLYVDDSCKDLVNFETGGNEVGVHYTGVNWGRDVAMPSNWVDIKSAVEGDVHPATGGRYEVIKGAEIGNIFDVGTRYTEALGVRYTDEDNQLKTPLMGCHGIGTTRIMGVLAEVYSDEKGLKWPENIAPYKYHLISFAGKNDEPELIEQVYKNSLEFYNSHAGDVLWDDRGAGIGEKLTDAEKIGCPVIVVISTKNIQEGVVEIRYRKSGEVLKEKVEI